MNLDTSHISGIDRRSPTGPHQNGTAAIGPPGLIAAAEYRQLMSGFPTGVAVVTALTGDGDPRGLTCSSLTSATLHPPTLLVSLRSGSITLAAVQESGRFAVNLLHTGGQAAAQVFSTPTSGRFDRVVWRATPRLGLPWLVEDAFAVAECTVAGSLTVGGHTVVLGEVTAAVREPGNPLLYGFRRYSGWREPLADESPVTSQRARV